MQLTVSSNVLIDEAIIEALAPPEATPFETLLQATQECLDRMKKSLFFRRYIEENFTHIRHARVLRISRSSNDLNAEWLVITNDLKIRFMRLERGVDDLVFYGYGEQEHETYLLNKSRGRLEKMCGNTSCMNFLLSRFGTPSFSVEEVQAELTRNGKLTIINVRETRDLDHLGGDNLDFVMANLQFDLEVITIGYSDPLPIIDVGEFIIVLDIDPRSVHECTAFFKRLTPKQRRRLWTTKPDDESDSYYTMHGYALDIISFPGYQVCMEMPREVLLQLLSTMFTNLE